MGAGDHVQDHGRPWHTKPLNVLGWFLVVANAAITIAFVLGVWPVNKWIAVTNVVALGVSAYFRGRTDELQS